MSQSPESYLKQKGIKYKNTGSGNVRFPCPVCGRKDTFDLKLASGLWRCKAASCGEAGNLYQLKTRLGDAVEVRNSEPVEAQAQRMFRSFDSPMDKMVEALWASPAAQPAKDYVEKRKLDHRILRLCKVGWAPRLLSDRGPARVVSNGLLAIPYFETRGSEQPYNGKMRWVEPEPMKDGKKLRYTKFRAGELGLYAPLGLDLSVPVLLVGGEIDTLSLVQLGLEVEGFLEAAKDGRKKPCQLLGFCPVGVPNGEGSWSDVWTSLLEPAEDIVVAFDADNAGHRGAQTVAAKLGSWRVRIAPDWPDSDPNKCLENGLLSLELVRGMIKRAKSKAEQAIYTAPSAAKRIARQRMRPEAAGWSTGLPEVDKLIGNLRPWEMTILTGHTGSGKSTFGFQVLDNAANALGLKVLVCAFEGGPDAALLRMAHLHHGEPVPVYEKGDTPEIIAAKEAKTERMVEQLGPNVYALRHMGVIDPGVWKETLHYCLARVGINIVMIDLINNMVEANRGRWDAQDRIVHDTQKLIADRDVGCAHCLLVAHPSQNPDRRNPNRDNYVMSLGDLKGHSDLPQACQGAIQMFRPRNQTRDKQVCEKTGLNLASLIALKGGRNSRGGEGKVELRHDPHSHRFSDMGLKEKEDEQSPFTIKESRTLFP